MLDRMSGGELIGFFAVVGSLAVIATTILGSLWAIVRRGECHTRRVELETNLKQDMINRGMPVDEIERVLAAGPTKSPGSACRGSSHRRAERKSCV